jgi:hypothetical protein
MRQLREAGPTSADETRCWQASSVRAGGERLRQSPGVLGPSFKLVIRPAVRATSARPRVGAPEPVAEVFTVQVTWSPATCFAVESRITVVDLYAPRSCTRVAKGQRP